MADDFWNVEPPWIAYLPASYAAYYREVSPEGRPRWMDRGPADVQNALLAAILSEIREAK